MDDREFRVCRTWNAGVLRDSGCCQEYQENQSALTIENVEINQTVNLYGCKNSTVIIKGKCNAITLGQSLSAVTFT